MKKFVLFLSLATLFNLSILYCQVMPENEKKSKGWVWKGKKLKKSEVKSLLFSHSWKDVSQKYTKEVSPGESFLLLNDNRFLIKFPSGAGVLYPTEMDYSDINMENLSVESQFMITPEFIHELDSYIQHLSKSANLNLSKNDKFDKLRLVDDALNKKGWGILNKDEYLLPMIAYCGQVIISETSGKWIRQNDVYNIELPSKEVILVSDLVRKDFVNTPSSISFAGVFYEQLHHDLREHLKGETRRSEH